MGLIHHLFRSKGEICRSLEYRIGAQVGRRWGQNVGTNVARGLCYAFPVRGTREGIQMATGEPRGHRSIGSECSFSAKGFRLRCNV